MIPMIFAAFANDESKSLSLAKERDALRKIFNDATKIELRILENASFDYINETIINEKLQDRIIIFHYGGHADGKNISLIDGEAKSEGLAKLLKSLSNLQLVFLNGCDTYDQVGDIQKEGVTAAIVTTLKPLNDEIAIYFTNYFYYAFYRFISLNDSFESAETRIVAKFGLESNEFIKLDRGIGLTDTKGVNDKLDNSKTVYVITSSEQNFLKRSLLFNIDYTPPPTEDVDYVPNRMLIKSLSKSILTGSFISEVFTGSTEYINFETSYKAYQQEESNRNFGLVVLDVLALLPFPLSFHINILKANATNWINLDRDKKAELLKRQIITYNSLIQLLSFTLLSSFWSELEKNKSLTISPSQWKVIKTFLSSNELNNQDINYPALLVTIREIFEANNLDPFITEYKQLKNIFENEDDFYSMHLHMQGLKASILNGEIKKMDINWLCQKTEDMLCIIFSKVGFVIRYKLTTVKNIEISKSRLKDPAYYIQRIILDGATVEEDDIAVFTKYTDSRSVIMAKGIGSDTFTEFLSLSPFIIDENALKGENLSKLFFYSYSEGDSYVYRWAEDPDKKLKINRNTYPGTGKKIEQINRRMEAIKDELDAFKELINPKT